MKTALLLTPLVEGFLQGSRCDNTVFLWYLRVVSIDRICRIFEVFWFRLRYDKKYLWQQSWGFGRRTESQLLSNVQRVTERICIGLLACIVPECQGWVQMYRSESDCSVMPYISAYFLRHALYVRIVTCSFVLSFACCETCVLLIGSCVIYFETCFYLCGSCLIRVGACFSVITVVLNLFWNQLFCVFSG